MSAGSFLFVLESFGRPLPPAPRAVPESLPVGSEMLAVAELSVRARFVDLGSLGFHSRNLFLVPFPPSGRLLSGVVSKDSCGVELSRRDLVGVCASVGFLRAPDVSGMDVTVKSMRNIQIITKRIGRQILAEETGPKITELGGIGSSLLNCMA